jgi:hypothetical protein
MSKKNRHHPPRLAEKLFRRILPESEKHPLLGDYEELYKDLAQRRGRLIANLWYGLQIVLTIPTIIWDSTKWSTVMFKNNLIIAWRNIRKSKLYSAINILGLAVGMTCCILIFLWVKDELSFDRFHSNHDRLYRAVLRTEGTWWTSSGWALAPTLKREYPEIRNATRFASRNILFTYEDRSLYRRVALKARAFHGANPRSVEMQRVREAADAGRPAGVTLIRTRCVRPAGSSTVHSWRKSPPPASSRTLSA